MEVDPCWVQVLGTNLDRSPTIKTLELQIHLTHIYHGDCKFELLRIIPKHSRCASYYLSSVLDKRPWGFSVNSRVGGVSPALFIVCVVLPVGPVPRGDTCDRNVGHSTRALGCSGCPFGWCDPPMAMLSCCPASPPEPPTPLLPHEHFWALEQPGEPQGFRSRGAALRPGNRKGWHRHSPAWYGTNQTAPGYADKSKSATENTDFLSSS